MHKAVQTNIVLFACENQVDNLRLVLLIAESHIREWLLCFDSVDSQSKILYSQYIGSQSFF